MNGVDYAIICIATLSAVIGIWRGFVREAISVAVWVLSFLLAYSAAGQLEVMFESVISDRPIRLAAAFVTIFLLIHIVGFFVARLLLAVIKTVGLRGVDRVLGMLFGVLRGVVVVAALVLIIEMTPLVEEEFWQNSFMVEVFGRLLDWAAQYLPLSNNTDLIPSA